MFRAGTIFVALTLLVIGHAPAQTTAPQRLRIDVRNDWTQDVRVYSVPYGQAPSLGTRLGIAHALRTTEMSDYCPAWLRGRNVALRPIAGETVMIHGLQVGSCETVVRIWVPAGGPLFGNASYRP